MQRLLVIGGSAGIGWQTVLRSLEAGWETTVLCRHPERITLQHERLEVIGGDALNAADVQAAVSGTDAVVQSLGVPLNLRLLTGPITLFSAATRVLVNAMQTAGVERLVAVTGFGAGRSQAAIHPLQRIPFNLVFGRAYADKSVQEELIEASSLRWTIARPGVLTNGRLNPDYLVLTAQDSWRNGLIARASVADFIVSCIREGTHVHEAPVLIEPLF